MAEYGCFTHATNPLVGGTVTLDFVVACDCKQHVLITTIKGDFVIEFDMKGDAVFGAPITIYEGETVSFGDVFKIKLSTLQQIPEYRLMTSAGIESFKYFKWKV